MLHTYTPPTSDMPMKNSTLHSMPTTPIHDFEMVLGQSISGPRSVRIVFLRPNDLKEDHWPAAVQKLDRMIALTGGRDMAVALLLSEDEQIDSPIIGRSGIKPLLKLQRL